MKNKKNLIIIAIVIAISLIGVTYAFFEYYGIGANQKITAGKVNLTLNEGEDTINRSNIFPETITQARSRADNFITFTVSGVNTTEDEDIYYEIMLNEGDSEEGMTRFNSKDLVFDLVELDKDGNEVTYLVDALSFDDFNERRIWVNTVSRDTSLTVNKTYKLRMWLDEDVLISDTDPYADYPATGYENHYASVKVSVYGDFVKKQQPYNYLANLGTAEVITETETIPATFWPESIETVKSNVAEVNFVSMKQDLIDSRYEVATIKADVSDKTKGGSVKVWLENGELVTAEDGTETQYYTMYVASEGMTFLPESCFRMFNSFINVTNIYFENVNTKNVTNMGRMFNDCEKLLELDLSSFDTGQVTDMQFMFWECKAMVSVDVSNFDTSNVRNMSSMFCVCKELVRLDASDWDTSQVTDMQDMFYACYKLVEIGAENWDTSQVTNMEQTFRSCSSLTSLDLSGWDTSKVTNFRELFMYCSLLSTLDISTWNTSNVSNMSYMFYNCSELTSLDVSSFDLSKATTTVAMFYGCKKLATIFSDSDWNVANISESGSMFGGCSALVGVVSYNSSMTNITMANPTTGYFTKKEV